MRLHHSKNVLADMCTQGIYLKPLVASDKQGRLPTPKAEFEKAGGILFQDK